MGRDDALEKLLRQVLDKLTDLQEGQQAIEQRLVALEQAQLAVQTSLENADHRLTAVYQQAGFLTEFQSETRQAITTLSRQAHSVVERQDEQSEVLGRLAYRSVKHEADLSRIIQVATT